jgi:magnesium chelatase subunit H
MQITVLYVGTSLLAPLKSAEREINRVYGLDLRVATYNFGSPLEEPEWQAVERDLGMADLVFVIHIMDGENGSRLLDALERHQTRHKAVVVINCMPELMRRTRMGQLEFSRTCSEGEKGRNGEWRKGGTGGAGSATNKVGVIRNSSQALRILGTIGSWMAKQARRDSVNGSSNHSATGKHTQYLKLVELLPGFLKLVPTAGRLRDVKNYLFLFCYFLQPNPANIRAMLLFALRQYVPHERLRKLKVALPQAMPAVAIYHPDAPRLFESFVQYEEWYLKKRSKSKVQSPKSLLLAADSTIGLLLMRPQVISEATRHYDALIRAIEAEGLSVIPAISTLMDNREACEKFFINKTVPDAQNGKSKVKSPRSKVRKKDSSRVSQIVSLTGFSFVGGPAMNDSDAAARFLLSLNRPYRSAVSLDMQTIEAWSDSQTGLNPVQSGMQIAIPEIDGATEPFVYGGIRARGFEPTALDDRCQRLARRLSRWNRLQTVPREELKLALVLFCFPPNKGNVGTAADLDVFPSVWDTLKRLKAEGYRVEVPSSADALRDSLLRGNSETFTSTVNVAYQMNVDEYRQLCSYVGEVEREWGVAPGRINAFGRSLLIQGVVLGNVFLGVQPTFGYEGDPMRLMMARSGAPHHGFLAFYTYLEKVFAADAVVHVGTHGALEFMPGKQVGLSGECWPDRLIGELPNVYLYSVNNPSEGSIAKRRSYAELISYLTPPIENAGLYRELANLKELVMAYRQTDAEPERQRLFESIEAHSLSLNLSLAEIGNPRHVAGRDS